MDELVRELMAFWELRGVALNPGASESQLDRIERELGFALPADVRWLYGRVDGVYDGMLFDLYASARLPEETREWEEPGHLVFGDYSIAAYAYALDLGGSGRVMVTGHGPVASSFVEFWRLYLHDPEKLLMIR